MLYFTNMRLSNITLFGLSVFILFASVVVLTPLTVFGKIGVGMGAGEIRVTESIKPGGIYTLPSLRIFNTGDETTTYGMDVAYHQDHPELRPSQDWFTFNPPTFTVEPGQSQEVEVTMLVPVKTTPGDYFAFVESGPVAGNGPGTSVGVAVATKLYFTVVYANVWQAITYRVVAFFNAYSPLSWIGLALLSVVFLGVVFARFFSLNISFRKNVPKE
jgi:hypothetical protein